MKIVIVGAGRGLGHVLAQMLAEKREIARANFHKITSPVPWLHMYPSERK